MEHCNDFPTPTKVEAPIWKYDNSTEAKKYWTNSYEYIIGMILCMTLKTRPYIYFDVNQCAWFNHNTKA